MPSIFSGMDEIADQYLGLDETWRGQSPRFMHRETLLRLCSGSGADVDGVGLIHELFDQILRNWNMGGPKAGLPSSQNWRFEKRTDFSIENTSPEVLLERTIAAVVDPDNWANQVPVDSGLLSGSPHWIDLVFRSGTEFSLIELKYASNTPLSAAFQVLRYGLVYAFFRSHAEVLGVNLDATPLLRASKIQCKVLAPVQFYDSYGPDLKWLSDFEKSIQTGLQRFSLEISEAVPEMTFGFEEFPGDFSWTPETAREIQTQKEVLWAIHHRQPVFPP